MSVRRGEWPYMTMDSGRGRGRGVMASRRESLLVALGGNGVVLLAMVAMNDNGRRQDYTNGRRMAVNGGELM